MNESILERIQSSAKALKIDLYTTELTSYADEKQLTPEALEAVCGVFKYLEPKTFERFDFSRLHGKHVQSLKNISSLSALYARKNLAFIGPQGVGKTHLAMAFGRECCLKGYKTYFLRASELNQKLTDARKHVREGTVINGLVKSSCLIIDEIGRYVFDKENTRMFFDVIDRRYNKDDPSTMIFTSNKTPNQWGEYFSEDDMLLCSLDRVFDDATVFMIKGDSYRGRKLETLGLEAGIAKHTEFKNA